MLSSLLLCFISFQDQPFYVLYEKGLEAISARNFSEAIEYLEGAVENKPESKKNAKTYGVQFIEYYPYNQLAFAYYQIGEFEKARAALDQAYVYAENQDENARSTMDLISNNLAQLAAMTAPPERTTIDTSRVIELIADGDLLQATTELTKLEEEHPNEAALGSLRELLDVFVDRSQRLNEALADRNRDIQEAIALGRQAEIAGNLEEALLYFQTASTLDNSNPTSKQAISRIKSQLEAAGRTDQEIQNTIIARLEDKQNELLAAKSRIDALTKDLSLAQESLQVFKNRPIKVPINLDVDFDLLPIDYQTFRAHMNILIQADQPLKDAKLYINDLLIDSWDLDGRKEFRAPFFDNYQFPQNRNLLSLAVTDIHGEHSKKSQSFTFTILSPDSNNIRNSQILLTIVTLILFLFFIKKRKSRLAFRNRFNPYIAGAPVLNENMFFGRKPLLRQILNTLHNNSIMIFGERRIGKTSFLHQLNAILPEIDDAQYEFIPAFIDLQGVSEDQFFSVIDQEICHSIESKHLTTSPTPAHLDARSFTQRLRDHIRQLKNHCEKEPKLVLLLDEVDVMNEFSEKTNQQLRSVFMKSFAKHLVAVMAGIHINTSWKSQGSPWYNFFEQIQLKPFPKSQALDLITSPVKGVYQFNKDAVEMIISLSQGKPYLIQKLCVNLVAHVLNENRRKVTTRDVQFVYREIKNEVWTGA